MQDFNLLLNDDLKRSIPLYFRTQYILLENLLGSQNLTFNSSGDYINFFKSSFPFLNDILDKIKDKIYNNINGTNNDLKKIFKENFSISSYVSDPHDEWNVVRIITVKEKKYVYKKGYLKNYLVYQDFIKQFSSCLPNELKTLKVHNYNYDTFILQEYIHRDEAFTNIELFNYQIGFLAILLFLLCATDAHFENFIMSNDGLSFVDLENIFQPLKWKDVNTEKTFTESIFSTGILPTLITIPNKGIFDFSPLSKNNWFSLPGNFIISDNIKEGMIDAVNFISANKKRILEYFASLTDNEYLMRVTLKPTLCYGMLYNRLSESNWRNKNDVILESLHLLNKNELHSKEIMELEMDMILNFQVPIFYCYNNSRSLISNFEIKNYFKKTGINRAIGRLKCKLREKNILELMQKL